MTFGIFRRVDGDRRTVKELRTAFLAYYDRVSWQRPNLSGAPMRDKSRNFSMQAAAWMNVATPSREGREDRLRAFRKD